MQPFEPDDLYQHRTLQDLGADPRHSTAVFVVSRASRKHDRYRSTLWTIDTRAGHGDRAKRLTAPQFDVGPIALSPDGTHVAFLSERTRERGPQVHVLPLDGGEARALTGTRIPVRSVLAWSDDGRRLLATQKMPWAEDELDDVGFGDGRPHVIRHVPFKLDGAGMTVGHRTRLVAIDAASGALTPLVEGDFDVDEARWAPDGATLAFVRRRAGKQRHQTDLWLADADGGHARQVTDSLYSLGGLRFSPDGHTLAFGAGHIEGDSIVQLYLHELRNGQTRCPCGEALQLDGTRIVWHRDGARVATIGARAGLFQIVVVDIDSGRQHPFEVDPRQVTALAASGDGLAFVAASLRECDELYRVGWDGKSERRLTAFNRKWFGARRLPRVEKRRFEVPDGIGGTERVDAWLLSPAQGDGPYPLLVDFHGGPQSVALIDYASHVYWYALCSQGWAVLAPNTVGSGSYGPEFARRLRGHWGEYDLPQVDAMLEQLQHERVCDERLACAGKSYGGFLSAWAVGQSDRFRAVVISAPVTNVESHLGTSDTGYYVTPYSMGGEINELRERYHRISPIDYCTQVSAATLLLQGADDQRCPLGQAEEMFANLARCASAPTKMVVYPGAHHSLARSGKPKHRVDYHARICAWVRAHT